MAVKCSYFILIFTTIHIFVSGKNQSSYISTLNSDCVTQGIRCADCQTMEFCLFDNGYLIKSLVECKSINSKNIYCDTSKNECTSDRKVCDEEINSITPPCFGEGYLPDPLDCTRYMMCVHMNNQFTGNIIDCSSSDSVYSHVDKGCVQKAPCIDFSNRVLCKNKPGRIVTYPPDESIYARCPPDDNTSLWIQRCPKPYEFNLQSGTCKPVCRSSGKIVDYFSDSKYYECVKNESGFIIIPRRCPQGTKFNDNLKICDENGTNARKLFGPVLISEHNSSVDTFHNRLLSTLKSDIESNSESNNENDEETYEHDQ